MRATLLALCLLVCTYAVADTLVKGFRPPSVPLIVFDPYMNIWSNFNNLHDGWPSLWDGANKGMSGMIRVDGQAYRFMGPNAGFLVTNTAQQTSVQVLPTTTVYEFTAGGVKLTLRFVTPAVPTDLKILSQPITYLVYNVASTDGKQHKVELYTDISGELTTNDSQQSVTWSSKSLGNLKVMQIGTDKQTYFQPKGDGVGINWGYAYVTVPAESGVQYSINSDSQNREAFIRGSDLPAEDTRKPRLVSDQWPTMAVRWSFSVSPSATVTKHLTFAYDDVYSMSYFGTNFKALWTQYFSTTDALLTNAETKYKSYLSITKKLDKAVLAQTSAAGGAKYSTIAALCWRQTFGAHKLVWNSEKNMPWLFLKEISSNGDFSTVDVLFPAIPLLLWTNPELAELILLPHLSYAAGEAPIKYGLEWAPHQLGTWPVADATPQSQEQMPVEETGNLLLIAEWLAQKDVKKYTSHMYPAYKSTLDGWAKYLTSGYQAPASKGTLENGIDRGGSDLPNMPIVLPQGSTAQDCQARCVASGDCASWSFSSCDTPNCWLKGSNTATTQGNCRTSGYIPGKLVLPDPGYQLCTDDFLGPIPHNLNLAAKGIISVDAYANFLTAVGRGSEAANYNTIAKSFAKYFVDNGKDGDHYRLQYNLPNSYSMMYNMIFQRLLKTNTFPESVLTGEVNYYLKSRFNKYGSPLNSNAAADGRAFTKFDWLSWVGAMSPNASTANRFWEVLYNYANETPSRVPLSDWYDTKAGTQVGFQARPVVGGFYAWMLLQNNGSLVF